MLRQISKILTCIIIFHSSSCGTWGGNPPKDQTQTAESPEKQPIPAAFLVGLKLKQQSNSSFDVVSSTGEKLGRVTLTVHKYIMRDVSIFRGSKPAKPQFEGPYLVDLINGTIDPQPAAANFETGAYENIAFNLGIAQKGQFSTLRDDDIIIGNSSHLQGTFETMGIVIPFETTMPIEQSLDFVAKLPSGSSNVVLAVENQKLVIGFRPDQWVVDTDLSKFADQQALIQMAIDGIRDHGTLEVEK